MELDKKDEEILDNLAANKRVRDNMLRYWPMISLVLTMGGVALYNTAVWAFDVEREIKSNYNSINSNNEDAIKDLSTHKEIAAEKLAEFNTIKNSVSELKIDSEILKSDVSDIKETQNTTNALLTELTRTMSMKPEVYQQPGIQYQQPASQAYEFNLTQPRYLAPQTRWGQPQRQQPGWGRGSRPTVGWSQIQRIQQQPTIQQQPYGSSYVR